MSRLLLLVIVCLFLYTNLYSQITYNIAKPMSYGNAQLNTLENLPTLDFDVKANGSVFNNELDINVKTLADTEKLHGKNIARLKFKIKALSLGEMSLYFKDVKLQNGAYCFVYTNDYKIVAGPIYEKSINGNLNIMKLPASELILEVVYNQEQDFDLTLDGITYQSLVDLTEKKKKKKNEHEILSGYDSCYTCDYGQVKYVDRALNCGYFGHGHNNEIFNLQNLKSATDYNYDAIRSSCLIMIPEDCEENIYSGTAQGTLMNFPYEDCSDPNNDCGKGFIFTVWHELNTNIIQKHLEEDYEYLDNVLIRFNWNYKYGTPWHLENVNCDSSNPTLYNQWRSTVSFDDVIDYCGVRVFAFRNPPADLTILKMNQRPFYKEHHLGWTTQANFDVFKPYEFDPDNYYKDPLSINKEDFKVIGKRKPKPNMVMENHNMYFDRYDNYTKHDSYTMFNLINESKGDIHPGDSLSGYSASQLTYYDYNNPGQRIGLGIMTTIDDSLRTMRGYNYYYYFERFTTQYAFLDECYYDITTFPSMIPYLQQFEDDLLERQFTHKYITYDTTTFVYDTTFHQSSHVWYPSANIKQKCPSNIGRDSTGIFTDSCDFNINTYVDYIYSNDTLCITIDSIPLHLFPDSYLPMGYRVYHNFGEQKTLAFDSFADSANISYPIEFCLTKCDIMHLMALGRENINIAIDFYDAYGRILNNPGCDDLNFSIAFPFNFCNMFDIQVTKVDSSECCTYEVELVIDECTLGNSLLNLIKNSLFFESGLDVSPIPIHTMDNIAVNYSESKITFTFSVCSDAPDSFDYEFILISGDGNCSTEPIEFDGCLICDCQFGVEMQNWVELTVEPDMDCGPNKCKVTGQFNIPSIYDCYERYVINSHPFKIVIPPNGSISWYDNPINGCLERGEFRQDTIKLYRSPSDTEPCIIYKQAYCPIESFITSCTPDCEEVEWEPRDSIASFRLTNLGCPNCWVEADYVYRRNTCDSTQDLQILSFKTYSDESDPNACENCLLNVDDIHKEVVLQAILQNGMGFQPIEGGEEPEGECDETWRVVQAACWTHYTGVWGDFYIPCDSVECCSVGLRVCRFLGTPEYITVDTLVSNIAYSLCYDGEEPLQQHVHIMFEGGSYIDPMTGQWVSTWYGVNDTLDCLDRCTVLLGLQTDPGGYSYLGKRTFDFDIETKEYYGFDEIKIKMKFKQDFVDFYIDSDIESNNLTISISSLLGYSLIDKQYFLQKGVHYYQIRTNGLNTGMYLISVQINGYLLKTEKLLIIR